MANRILLFFFSKKGFVYVKKMFYILLVSIGLYTRAVSKMLENLFFLILFMILQRLTILTRLTLPLVVIFSYLAVL